MQFKKEVKNGNIIIFKIAALANCSCNMGIRELSVKQKVVCQWRNKKLRITGAVGPSFNFIPIAQL